MHPRGAEAQAFLAALRRSRCHGADQAEMRVVRYDMLPPLPDRLVTGSRERLRGAPSDQVVLALRMRTARSRPA